MKMKMVVVIVKFAESKAGVQHTAGGEMSV